MKTSEFIKRVEELGYSTFEKKGDWHVVNGSGYKVLSIRSYTKNKLDTLMGTEVDDDLFKVAFEYAQTPIEKRKDIKLTDDEIIYLKFAKLKNCNYVAKDKDGELNAYDAEPEKADTYWVALGIEDLRLTRSPLLFSFIKWQDDEPYNIDELLKGANQ